MEMRKLPMHTKIQNHVLTVRLTGELDHHSATEIREKTDKTYERSHCKHVLFDFTDVDFMDSSGIGLMIGRYKNAEKRGGKVAAVNMNSQLERIFNMSGLQKIVMRYGSVEEALQALQGKEAV
jgi:stage II sporulation protein AA (anti-sigma F factor antagonist)